MEKDDIQALPQYQQLQDAELQRARLHERLDGSTLLPEISAAYNSALQSLDEQLLLHARDEILQDSFAQYGTEGIGGLEQIKPLENILPEEEYGKLHNSLRERVSSTNVFFERYGAHTEKAKGFLEMLGSTAVSSGVGVSPVEEPAAEETLTETTREQPNEEPEIELPEDGEVIRTDVALRIRGNAVQIGKNGKIIPLSSKVQEKQKDYSHERAQALKLLVDKQGEEVTPYEIWQTIGNGDPFDKQTLTSVRAWFEKLTFRNQKLIEFNNKRGKGSRYRVSPSFKLELTESSVTTLEKTEPPLNLGDLYIAALHLEQFNPILEDRQIGVIKSKLVKELSEYAPDYSHLRGQDKAIRDMREEAVARIISMLDDDDRFFTFLGSADEKSPEYQFVEYMFGLDDVQRSFLKRLMRARVEREVISETEFRFWAIDAEDSGIVIASTPTLRKERTQLSVLSKEFEAPAKPAEAEPQTQTAPIVVTTTPEIPEKNENVGIGMDAVVAISGTGKAVKIERTLSEAEQEKLLCIADETRRIVEAYLNSPLGVDVDETHRRVVIQAVFSGFTTKVVREATEASIISRDQRHPEFSIREVIRILLYNNQKTQNILRTRKYRRNIGSIIEDIINSCAQRKNNGEL